MERTKLLILRLTNRCNLACRYCYAAGETGAGNEPGADLSMETAARAIDLLAKPGEYLKIQLTGGEPLLCTELMGEIFRYTREKRIRASFAVQTNGTLLTPRVCRLFKEMGCAVGVSLDGMGEANGLRIFGDGSPAFAKALEGIRNLAREGLCCNLNAVVTRVNQSHLAELLDLAAYLPNVRGVGLDMFRPLGRGKGEDWSPYMETLPADLEAMLEKQAKLSRLGVRVGIKELEKVRIMLEKGVRETCYCYAQTGDSLAVDPDGNLYPCSSFVGMPGMCMGNVWGIPVKGVEVLGNGSGSGVPGKDAEGQEKGFLSGISAKGTVVKVPGMDEECLACEDRALCRGGCPAGRAACGGKNEADCVMHRTMIAYGRKWLKEAKG